MPVYKELIEGKQEIMVGYSDSAKVRANFFCSYPLFAAHFVTF
jgi:phosphoenolpyruvate carboxylase